MRMHCKKRPKLFGPSSFALASACAYSVYSAILCNVLDLSLQWQGHAFISTESLVQHQPSICVAPLRRCFSLKMFTPDLERGMAGMAPCALCTFFSLCNTTHAKNDRRRNMLQPTTCHLEATSQHHTLKFSDVGKTTLIGRALRRKLMQTHFACKPAALYLAALGAT